MQVTGVTWLSPSASLLAMPVILELVGGDEDPDS
jgi:hypothetical protein